MLFDLLLLIKATPKSKLWSPIYDMMFEKMETQQLNHHDQTQKSRIHSQALWIHV